MTDIKNMDIETYFVADSEERAKQLEEFKQIKEVAEFIKSIREQQEEVESMYAEAIQATKEAIRDRLEAKQIKEETLDESQVILHKAYELAESIQEEAEDIYNSARLDGYESGFMVGYTDGVALSRGTFTNTYH